MVIGIQGAQVRSRGIEYSTEIRLSQMRYDNDILGLVKRLSETNIETNIG